MYDFTESITLSVPKIEKKVQQFNEGKYSSEHALVVEFAAIHTGMTSNFNYYPEDALSKSISSWTTPYPKPILKNHDPESEPIGRVIGASMDAEDGVPFIKIQAAISDPEAISKLLDGRYLTGSVGAKAEEALCSICNADWAERGSIFDLPCKHVKGKTYKGAVAFFKLGGLGWKEYSVVNVPADGKSRALSLSLKANEAEEVYPSRFYALNMARPEVLYLAESEDIDILPMMEPTEAEALYGSLRTAFLGAKIQEAETIVTDVDKTTTENVAEPLVIEEEEDDVLTAVESLKVSEDSAEEPTETPEDPEETPEETPEAPVAEEPAEEPEEEPAAEEEPEAEATPEPAVEDKDKEVAVPSEMVEQVAELTKLHTEASQQVETLQRQLEDTQSQLEQTTTENIKLRQAVKESLANRVVDLKINVGLAKDSERATLLAEHIKRSSQSLADSIKDLLTVSQTRRPANAMPKVEPPIVDEPNSNENTDDDDPATNPVGFFTDVLMGRRSIH